MEFSFFLYYLSTLSVTQTIFYIVLNKWATVDNELERTGKEEFMASRHVPGKP
jgi:hypothetical protein